MLANRARFLTTLMASLLGLVAVPLLHAAPIVFSGFDNGANDTDPRPASNAAQAAFSTAVGPTSLITFESAPLGSFSSLVVAPGVTMSSSSGEIRNSPLFTPDNVWGYNTTSGGKQFVSMLGGDLNFSFTTPIDAFGAFITGDQGPGVVGQETITFNDGSSQTVNIPNTFMSDGGASFVGFFDPGKQIVGVQLHFLNDVVGVDDVQFQATPVPEPTSLAVFGVALVGGVGCIWRWRRKPAVT